MGLADLGDWLDGERSGEAVWYVKRLSGNDTLANGSHQAGPYTPNRLAFDVFPELDTNVHLNPDVWIDLHVASHGDRRRVRLVYYNNRRILPSGTRNECRITNLGGASSPILDPENTGAVAVFVFRRNSCVSPVCNAWICRSPMEEELLEGKLGITLEPGLFIIWKPSQTLPFIGGSIRQSAKDPCDLTEDEIPADWLKHFPSGAEIIAKAGRARDLSAMDTDSRLLARRDCEFRMFRAVEKAFHSPRIQEGFKSIEDFLSLAQTILQSRKTRSGRSLELHVIEILKESQLVEDSHFSHAPVIEGGKRPDFLFPSKAAYQDPDFPVLQLRMLGAKTTVKDRWRQVINEADRIPVKHLLTLQEGVSCAQYAEMEQAGVRLVVPARLHSAYPDVVRPKLMTLSAFLVEVKNTQTAV